MKDSKFKSDKKYINAFSLYSSKIKSESILKIDPSVFKIVHEKEIKDYTGEFEISDGVGFAGTKIFDEFNAKYAFASKNSKIRHIAALQCRFKGFKGMITLNSDVAPNEIHLRPSMNKFENMDDAF